MAGLTRRTAFFQLAASARAAVSNDAAKRSRIALSSYCFYNSFVRTRDRDAPPMPGKPLELLDLPEMFGDQYHIHNLEVLAPHFESREAAYLREVRGRLDRTHSRIINIPVDIHELWNRPGLSAPDEKERKYAVSLFQPWLDVARAVGAQSIRCDPGKIDGSNLMPTITSYRELAEYAAPRGLYVIVENHGGAGSEHPEELIRILQAAGSRTGTLPDFGNFPDEATRQRGLKLLFPLARTICHTRDTEGAGSGKLVHFDFGQCMRISKEASYRGIYSIEAEAHGDVHANVQHVYDELMKYL